MQKINAIEFDSPEDKAQAELWLEMGITPKEGYFYSPLIVNTVDFAHVDETSVPERDQIFTTVNKAIIVDFSRIDPNLCDIDQHFKFFMVNPKRCYNKEPMREHMVKYINYFIKFYDKDLELLAYYYSIKYLIDYEQGYSEDNLINDLSNLIIFNESINQKITLMNQENYIQRLKQNRSKKIENLQYYNKHGKILMHISILMKFIIPIVSHYIASRQLLNKDLFTRVFNIILSISDCDMYSKLYETVSYEIKRNVQLHSTMWDKQYIRGIDDISHKMQSMQNVINNIIPRYIYGKNIISLNCSSIKKHIGYSVTDIPFERNFRSLSSYNRDEDFNSEFDKYESYFITQDENISIQNNINMQDTMERLKLIFGEIEPAELEFYKNNLSEDRENIIEPFQKNLIFSLFSKFFGEPKALYEINIDGYVALVIYAKRYLIQNNLIMLPHIIGGKVLRISNRRVMNTKEKNEILNSLSWDDVLEKYQRNEKIKETILSQITTIVTSSFMIIDYYDRSIHGREIKIDAMDIIREEFLRYISLI